MAIYLLWLTNVLLEVNTTDAKSTPAEFHNPTSVDWDGKL